MTKKPALDPWVLPLAPPSNYPAPFRSKVLGRERRYVGDALALTNFGVNLTRIPPGDESSQRHWHSKQDEFVFVLKGEVVLVTDAGEQLLRAGTCAGFPKGSGDGHKLVNRSISWAVYLEVGDRTPGDRCTYSDIDMVLEEDGEGRDLFRHKDGRPY